MDTYFDRMLIRENNIWSSFQFNGRNISAKINVIWGWYANTYKNMQSFLRSITMQELQQVIDTYEKNIALLTKEEAKATLDIAAKKYVQSIDNAIADIRRRRKQAELEAQRSIIDKKIEALAADRKILETKTIQYQNAISEAEVKLKELVAHQTTLESEKKFITSDIKLKKIDTLKSQIKELEAVNKGLSIQAQIVEAALNQTHYQLETQKVSLDKSMEGIKELNLRNELLTGEVQQAQINNRLAQTDNEKAKIDTQIKRMQEDTRSKQLDIQDIEIEYQKIIEDISRLDLDLQKLAVSTTQQELNNTKIELDTAQTKVNCKKLLLDNRKLDFQKTELESDIAQTEYKIANLELLDKDLEIITERYDNKSYSITEKGQKRLELIEAEISLLEKKVESFQDYEAIEAEKLNSEQTMQTSEQTLKVYEMQNNLNLKIHEVQTQLSYITEDANIRTLKTTNSQAITDSKIGIIETESKVADIAKNAAIDAAETLAAANIINTLTHQLGKA